MTHLRLALASLTVAIVKAQRAGASDATMTALLVAKQAVLSELHAGA